MSVVTVKNEVVTAGLGLSWENFVLDSKGKKA